MTEAVLRPGRDRREQQCRTLTRKGSPLFKQHLHFYGRLPPISCADSLSLLCVRAMAVLIALAPLSCVFAYVRYGLCNRRSAVDCALREPLLLNRTPEKEPRRTALSDGTAGILRFLWICKTGRKVFIPPRQICREVQRLFGEC